MIQRNRKTDHRKGDVWIYLKMIKNNRLQLRLLLVTRPIMAIHECNRGFSDSQLAASRWWDLTLVQLNESPYRTHRRDDGIHEAIWPSVGPKVDGVRGPKSGAPAGPACIKPCRVIFVAWRKGEKGIMTSTIFIFFSTNQNSPSIIFFLVPKSSLHFLERFIACHGFICTSCQCVACMVP